jgi:hypothetical protein
LTFGCFLVNACCVLVVVVKQGGVELRKHQNNTRSTSVI